MFFRRRYQLFLDTLKKNHIRLCWLPWAMVGVVALGQFVALVGELHRNALPQSIVSAIDNDSSEAISRAMKTRLYNDNGWRPYGPVFYRLAHLVQHLAGPAHNPDGYFSERDQKERRHHFALQVVSLLALYAMAWLLLSQLTGSRIWKLAFLPVLVSAFLYDSTWSYILLLAHPEILFAAVLCWFGYLLIRVYPRFDQSPHQFFLLAVALGVVCSTKWTILLFWPSFFVFIWYLGGRRLDALKKLFVVSVVTYLLVGFPQNIAIWEVASFLLKQKRNVVWGDLETAKYWLDLFGQQIWRPTVVLGVFALLAPPLARKYTWRHIGYYVVVLTPSILFFLSRKVLSRNEYYPFAFVALLLLGVSLATLLLRSQVKFDLPKGVRWGLLILVVSFWPEIQRPVPSSLDEQRLRLHACVDEIKLVRSKVEEVARDGRHILADPFIPFSSAFNKRDEQGRRQIEVSWAPGFDLFRGRETGLVALRRDYYRRYIPEAQGGLAEVVHHVEDAKRTADFYLAFFNKTQTVDPSGTQWQKVYSDRCGYELWKPTN